MNFFSFAKPMSGNIHVLPKCSQHVQLQADQFLWSEISEVIIDHFGFGHEERHLR